jgi:hypothetical protein
MEKMQSTGLLNLLRPRDVMTREVQFDGSAHE